MLKMFTFNFDLLECFHNFPHSRVNIFTVENLVSQNAKRRAYITIFIRIISNVLWTFTNPEAFSDEWTGSKATTLMDSIAEIFRRFPEFSRLNGRVGDASHRHPQPGPRPATFNLSLDPRLPTKLNRFTYALPVFRHWCAREPSIESRGKSGRLQLKQLTYKLLMQWGVAF